MSEEGIKGLTNLCSPAADSFVQQLGTCQHCSVEQHPSATVSNEI